MLMTFVPCDNPSYMSGFTRRCISHLQLLQQLTSDGIPDADDAVGSEGGGNVAVSSVPANLEGEGG